MNTEHNSNNIEVELINSVTSEKLIELSSDLGESFIDVMMEEGVIKNIPIIGAIYKFAKAGIGIREQYFTKKIYLFLLGIKDISSNARMRFIEDLNNPSYGQRAGETLLMLLERFDHMEKPKILARLLQAKVLNKIDMNNFLRLANVLEKSYVHDLFKLSEYRDSKQFRGNESECLLSYGLIYLAVIDQMGIDRPYKLTSMGEDLLKYGIESDC
jgi:hypothetical protein